METTKRLGRPLNEHQVHYTLIAIQLEDETNKHLKNMINSSYMSKTGIVRMAIDYLYYVSNGLELPNDLSEAVKDLTNKITIE